VLDKDMRAREEMKKGPELDFSRMDNRGRGYRRRKCTPSYIKGRKERLVKPPSISTLGVIIKSKEISSEKNKKYDGEESLGGCGEKGGDHQL